MQDFIDGSNCFGVKHCAILQVSSFWWMTDSVNGHTGWLWWSVNKLFAQHVCHTSWSHSDHYQNECHWSCLQNNNYRDCTRYNRIILSKRKTILAMWEYLFNNLYVWVQVDLYTKSCVCVHVCVRAVWRWRIYWIGGNFQGVKFCI